jgi:hypothetical protein
VRWSQVTSAASTSEQTEDGDADNEVRDEGDEAYGEWGCLLLVDNINFNHTCQLENVMELRPFIIYLRKQSIAFDTLIWSLDAPFQLAETANVCFLCAGQQALTTLTVDGYGTRAHHINDQHSWHFIAFLLDRSLVLASPLNHWCWTR